MKEIIKDIRRGFVIFIPIVLAIALLLYIDDKFGNRVTGMSIIVLFVLVISWSFGYAKRNK